MKIMFWVEVILTLFCILGLIYDLIVGEYIWAVFMAFWGMVDCAMAVLLGIEVWG